MHLSLPIISVITIIHHRSCLLVWPNGYVHEDSPPDSVDAKSSEYELSRFAVRTIRCSLEDFNRKPSFSSYVLM